MDLRERKTKEALRGLVARWGERLPEERYELLRARYIAGVSIPKIAEARGRRKQTIYEKLHRAVRELIAQVPEDDPDLGVVRSAEASAEASEG